MLNLSLNFHLGKIREGDCVCVFVCVCVCVYCPRNSQYAFQNYKCYDYIKIDQG